MTKRLHLAQLALLVVAVVSLSSPAFSQSCALCYTQAASAGRHMIEALRSGIIVLMIPPACMSVGITLLAYRKRNKFKRDDGDTDEPDDRW